jgi:hypothetical protein
MEAFFRATLRAIAAISRSSERTPASRVYWLMTVRSALSPIRRSPRL